MAEKIPWIRNLYLYLVSAITLFMIAFALVSLVNLGLRTWIFPKADNNNYPTMVKPVDAYCTVDKNGVRTCPSTAEQTKLAAQDQATQDAQAAEQRTAQRQRDLVENISMLVVAIPLFIYHWMVIRRDRKQTA